MTLNTFTFSAFAASDLFAGTIGFGKSFTQPAAATREISVRDDDGALAGKFFGFPLDFTGQKGEIEEFGVDTGNGGRLFAEKKIILTGSDGKFYTLVEIKQQGNADSILTYVGDVPPVDTTLTVWFKTVSFGVSYENLGAGPLPENIVDIAIGNDSFTLLERALIEAGLVDTVREATDITVFAPTDAAFVQLAVDLGFTGDTDNLDDVFDGIVAALSELGDPIELLTNVLLYHVSPDAKTQAEIEAAGEIATLLEGATFSPENGELVDNEPDVANPQIVIPDITASNGTIQAIDRVLIPLDLPGNELPNVLDVAEEAGNFTLLARALTDANLAETVGGLEDVTVFAPTDAAFVQLAVDLGFEGNTSDLDAVYGSIVAALTALSPDNDPIPLLADVLLYHVSPGAKSAAEIDAAETVETLLTDATFGSEGVELIDNEPDVDNPTISGPDIATSNGTLQIIDRVLIPLDIPGNGPANVLDIAEDAGSFTLLARALDTAMLTETVRGLEDVTVFAPTDDAFVQLAVDLGFTGDTGDLDAVFDAIVAALTDLSGGNPVPLLTDVLLYHVSPGAKTAAEIDAEFRVPTLLTDATFRTEGSELVDNEPDIANPSIVGEDIETANGTLQIIDRVLIPLDVPGNDLDRPTITELVAASGEFDSNPGDFDLLLAAVQAAGLADKLSTEELTVFAPNDGAFMNLATGLGFKGSTEAEAFGYIVDALTLLSKGDDPIPLLKTILEYHTVEGTLNSDAVLASDTIETAIGASLGVDGTSLVDGDPDLSDPSIVGIDLKASNGIVHTIDNVLIPLDILPTDGSNSVDFVIGSDKGELIRTFRDNDFASGLGGNDLINLGQGNDVGLGGEGNDIINGFRGFDTLVGGEGDDIIAGHRGFDILDGGAGNDLIFGGRGNDTMEGGTGADRFLFQRFNGEDTIVDFETGNDVIVLDRTGFDQFEDIEDRISDIAEGALVDLGSTLVTVQGVAKAQLSEDDFLFT
ncbi:MAG: fasciclin domain-containing protein [Pseudomonadota bacterium]